MIPKAVKHADLMTALEPLMDLLGTDVRSIFASPHLALSIGAGDSEDSPLGVVTFATVQPRSDLESQASAADCQVGEGEYAVEARLVTVQVR